MLAYFFNTLTSLGLAVLMKKFSKVSILVCTHVQIGLHNKSCGKLQSLDLISKLKDQIENQGLDISVREQPCFGRCEEAIVAKVYPKKDTFTQVTEASLAELVKTAKGNIE